MNYMEIVRCKWLFPGNLISEMHAHCTPRIQTGIVIASSAFLFSQFQSLVPFSFLSFTLQLYTRLISMSVKLNLTVYACVKLKLHQGINGDEGMCGNKLLSNTHKHMPLSRK